MQALQKMGEALLGLSDTQLSQIALSEDMVDALVLYKRLKHREARRRQLQLIGKLMRLEDVEAIEQSLARFDAQSKVFHQHFHAMEQLRDSLINEGDQALAQLLGDNDQLDRQHLRQLIRQAQTEQKQQKPPAASRKLFRYLRDNINPLN
jgi:ribosome-associated protein